VVLAWSLERIVPVRIDSYTARETAFDAMLQPVQASVDISLTVLRGSDLGQEMKLANVLATAYQTVRTTAATAGLAQGVELML
jgi:hypothetical protein